jgi:hypothetical protein
MHLQARGMFYFSHFFLHVNLNTVLISKHSNNSFIRPFPSAHARHVLSKILSIRGKSKRVEDRRLEYSTELILS